MTHRGWIPLHRKLLDNPVVMRDADHLAIWVFLLMRAAHQVHDITFGGARITIQPGELVTGRKRISSVLKISESKVQRILKRFEAEQQIEQRTDRQKRLIRVTNWQTYSASEQRFEQRVNNGLTVSESDVPQIEQPSEQRTDAGNHGSNSGNCDVSIEGEQRSEQRVNNDRTTTEHIQQENKPTNKEARIPDKDSSGDVSEFIAEEFTEFAATWNSIPGLKPAQRLSGARRAKFRTRMADPHFRDGWRAALGKARDSLYLSGKAWFTFDWVLHSEHNFTKLAEGNYDDDSSDTTAGRSADAARRADNTRPGVQYDGTPRSENNGGFPQ